ncbi:hypothetical protein KW791_00225 [Candidatus Parcubacteria bacterium]|nr:hypothetical protein [Candidatus Parcubacteria bacterium]
MTVEKRLRKDDPQSYIIMLIYKEAKKHPQDGQWRKFRGLVEQAGHKFNISADFLLRGSTFTYKELEVKPADREIFILN